jgi:hypothetical protein
MQLVFPSSEWIVAWATVALALATVLVIVFSYRHEKDLVHEQKRLVKEQKNLVEAQNRQLEVQTKLADLEKEQNQLAALVVIFQLLDDNAHRNARRRIINLYTDDSDRQKWGTLILMNVVKKEAGYAEHFLQSNYLESREMVKADFNHMGALIKSRLVEKEQFLESYWLEVLKCAESLRNSFDESSMENFNYLTEQAEEYRKDFHAEQASPLNMSKEEFKKRFRDVGDIALE